MPYEERLANSLERRRLQADLILAFEIFKGDVDLSSSTRAHLQITARTKPTANQRSCKRANVAGNIANATGLIIRWSYRAHAY